MKRQQFLISLFILIICATIKVVAQNDAGYHWSNVKIGGGGFVTGIITTPSEKNLIYARTDVGGAYRWNEDTQGWIPLLDWNSIHQTSYQGVESLAIDPSSPNIVYMMLRTEYWNNGISAILKSTDYGATFQIIDVTSQFRIHGNGMGRQTGERLAVDPNQGNILFCGTRLHGLFKSMDAGESWENVSSFPEIATGALWETNGISVVVFDPLSGGAEQPTQRIFASISRLHEDNLFVSEDAGETWEPVEGAINNLMVQRMIYMHGNLYITYADAAGPWNINRETGAVYKYDIAEKTWHDITPQANLSFGGIAVDYNNPDVIMVSTINVYSSQSWRTGTTVYGDRLYRSTNAGESWTSLFEANKLILDHSNIWDQSLALHWTGHLAIDPFNSDRVFAISGNGIFMTNNISEVETGKSTWHLQTDNLEETVPVGIITLPGGPVISVIYDYDGFVQQSAYIPGMRHRPSMGNTTGLDFAQNNPDFIVRSGEGGARIFYSTNRSTTWTRFTTLPDPNANRGFVAVSANGDKVIWRPDGANNTYFTTNLGTTWHPVHSTFITGRPFSDRVNNDVFYIYSGTNLRIFTYNASLNRYDMETVNLGVEGRELIRPVPHIEGEVWIACNNSGLRRFFKNQNNQVHTISSVSACQAIGFGKAPAGRTFPAVFIWGTVDGITGIFRSDDEGETWLRINDDDHQYGGPGNGHFITGDVNVFGRVYMSTVGRGIVMGYPDGETSLTEPYVKSVINQVQGIVFSQSLRLTSDAEKAGYQIFSVSGVLVEEGRFYGSVDVGLNLPAGIYIMIFTQNQSEQVVKIIKQ